MQILSDHGFLLGQFVQLLQEQLPLPSSSAAEMGAPAAKKVAAIMDVDMTKGATFFDNGLFTFFALFCFFINYIIS